MTDTADTPNPEDLERLEDQIDEARETAQDNKTIHDPDEIRYYQSGSIRPEDDDQAITP